MENRLLLAITTRTPIGGVLKHSAELRFWRDVWATALREQGYWSEEAKPPPGVHRSFDEAHWAEAQTLVARLLCEVGIDDPNFFVGKVAVDVGPGCVGMLEASGVAEGIAVDPLADRYRAAGLLLDADNVRYIASRAESLPLPDASVDVIVARNSLDHSDDPVAVIAQVRRVLRPGGSLLLVVDVGQRSNVVEPHSMTAERVRNLLTGFHIVHEEIVAGSDHAGRWHARKHSS